MKDKILLKHKILISIFGVIILFSLVFGTGMRMAIKQIEQQIAKSNNASLQVYYNTLQSEIERSEVFITNTVYHNDAFDQFLALRGDPGCSPFVGEIMDRFSEELKDNQDVAAYLLYDTDTDVRGSVFNSIVGYGSVKEEITDSLGTFLEEEEVPLGWFIKRIGSRTFLCRVMERDNAFVVGIYDLPQASKNAKLFYSYEGEIVFFNNQEVFSNEDFIQKNGIYLNYLNDSDYYFSNSKSYMVVQKQLIHFKVALISEFYNSSVVLKFLYMSPYLYIALGFVMVWILIGYLKSILFRPMDSLVQAMQKIEEGDLNVRVEEQGGREFQKVQQAFNHMISEITTLKIKSYEQQIAREKAQLYALKMQIRPHFFLNCLKSIFGLAQSEKIGQIQKAVVYLGTHLRYVFDQQSDLIPLEKEMQMCENYIELHRSIESGRAEIHISMDEGVRMMMVPPVSCLTLIENCMKHGMAQDGTLQIRIDARSLEMDGRHLADIVIRDNGPGFPEELLSELNHHLDETAALTGVGIRNVIQRFRLIYGEDFAVQFSNQSGAKINLMIQI